MGLDDSTRSFLFFFIDTATTDIYTLSLHDALPISPLRVPGGHEHGGTALLASDRPTKGPHLSATTGPAGAVRSEEHTSELQSLAYLVCRLLLEKKKKITTTTMINQFDRPR